MKIDGQITFGDVDAEYKDFVKKFEPKRTTDDCYTPENIYKAVLDWCVKEYGIEPDKIVRPFWPGGNYEEEEYPDGCTVVDNPPFSILTQIVRNYNAAGVKYFLFAPYLTNFSNGKECSHIITGTSITYENGAKVDTSFVTNLDKYLLRAVPDLAEAIKEEEKKNSKAAELPKYSYPPEVLTASMLGYIAKHGRALSILPEECCFVRELDAQKAQGKALFGAGFLLSRAAAERAAAERAAAERAAAKRAAAVQLLHVWQLSDREKAIVEMLVG